MSSQNKKSFKKEGDLLLIKVKNGAPGADGAPGATTYFHVKFSPNSDGSQSTDIPTKATKYMGVCSSQNPNKPTNPEAYTWTQCRGEDGEDGEDIMAGSIQSSNGMAFEKSQTGTTTLTARLYKGSTEIDIDGLYNYTWYTTNSEDPIGTGKQLTIDIGKIAGKSVYFEVDDGDAENTSVLSLARLGVMVLGKI